MYEYSPLQLSTLATPVQQLFLHTRITMLPKGLLDPWFISELYAGRTSDKQITKDCGVLDMLEPDDD